MQYRRIKKAGLYLSELSFGTWLHGSAGKEDKPGSPALIPYEQGITCLTAAAEAGINYFDTAPGYGGGQSEALLGDFIREYDRNDFVLSSKVFFPVSKVPNRRGLPRKHILASIDETLEKLQTDYLDIYCCHRFDYITPLEETISAMNYLIDEGKILHWGTSNWLGVELERAQGIALANGMKGPVIEQAHYSLLDRFIELELWHTLDYHKMGLSVWSPLEGGILTGKYTETIPEQSRIAQLKNINQEGHGEGHWLTPENLEKLRSLSKLAQELDITMGQLSLAWLLHKEQVTTLITGASQPSQIESNAKATAISLSDQTLARIEKILKNRPEYPRNWEIFNYRWFQNWLREKKDRKAWK
ncbi:MAG: aldo/keto reductase [Candidatus Thorarchaeota archaeon]